MVGSFIDTSPWLGMPSSAGAVNGDPWFAPEPRAQTGLDVEIRRDEKHHVGATAKSTKKEKQRKKNEALQQATPKATKIGNDWSTEAPPDILPSDHRVRSPVRSQVRPDMALHEASVNKGNDWRDGKGSKTTKKNQKENSKPKDGKSKVLKPAKEEIIHYGPVDTENNDWVEILAPVQHHQQGPEKVTSPSQAWIRPSTKMKPESTASSSPSTRPSLTTAFTSIFFDVDSKKAAIKAKRKEALGSALAAPPLPEPAVESDTSKSSSPLRYHVPAMSQVDTSPKSRRSAKISNLDWIEADHPPPPPPMAAESSGSSKAASIRSQMSIKSASRGSDDRRYMMSGPLQPAEFSQPPAYAADRPSSIRSVVGSHVSLQPPSNNGWQTYEEARWDAASLRGGEGARPMPDPDRASNRRAAKRAIAASPTPSKHSSSSSRRLRAIEDELALLHEELQRFSASEESGEWETAAAAPVSGSPSQSAQKSARVSRYGSATSAHKTRHNDTLVSPRSNYHAPTVADVIFEDPNKRPSALFWNAPPAGTRSPPSSTHSRHANTHISQTSHRSHTSRRSKVSGTGLGPFESAQTKNPEIWSPPPPPPASERWSPDVGAVQPFDSVSNVTYRGSDAAGSGNSRASKRTLRAPSVQEC